jgi:hypothetical protein
MPLEQSGRVRAQQETPRLSPQQKLDLVKLAAAGMISVIFFATPVLLSRETPAVTAAETVSAAPIHPTAPVAPMPRVEILTTEIAAAVSTPTLQTSRAAAPTVRRSASVGRARYALASSRTRWPLGRRIARLFAGDGSHTVRPFPTVASAMR